MSLRGACDEAIYVELFLNCVTFVRNDKSFLSFTMSLRGILRRSNLLNIYNLSFFQILFFLDCFTFVRNDRTYSVRLNSFYGLLRHFIPRNDVPFVLSEFVFGLLHIRSQWQTFSCHKSTSRRQSITINQKKICDFSQITNHNFI